MSTIHPKKIKSTNKSPEITRFVEFLNSAELSYTDIAVSTEIAERTIANYVHTDSPIGGQLLRGLHSVYGVSMDWLLSGCGVMYISDTQNSESSVTYESEKSLIPHHQVTDTDSMQDFWWLTAKAAEQSLMQAGAKPNQDYSIMDLYKLSQPFVLERFKSTNMDISVIGY